MLVEGLFGAMLAMGVRVLSHYDASFEVEVVL